MNKLRVPIQLHNSVINCLRSYLSTAEQQLSTSFIEPTIFYRQKGSVAGSALLNQWQIQLNLNMLLENREPFIDEVIPHELAHLIAYKQFGRVKPHGKEWQMVMEQIFNRQAKRTHAFNLPKSVQQNRYVYHCLCKEHLLTAIRHKKIQSKKAQYYCKSCKEELLMKLN